jgi:hypothetical protein
LVTSPFLPRYFSPRWRREHRCPSVRSKGAHDLSLCMHGEHLSFVLVCISSMSTHAGAATGGASNFGVREPALRGAGSDLGQGDRWRLPLRVRYVGRWCYLLHSSLVRVGVVTQSLGVVTSLHHSITPLHHSITPLHHPLHVLFGSRSECDFALTTVLLQLCLTLSCFRVRLSVPAPCRRGVCVCGCVGVWMCGCLSGQQLPIPVRRRQRLGSHKEGSARYLRVPGPRGGLRGRPGLCSQTHLPGFALSPPPTPRLALPALSSSASPFYRKERHAYRKERHASA